VYVYSSLTLPTTGAPHLLHPTATVTGAQATPNPKAVAHPSYLKVYGVDPDLEIVPSFLEHGIYTAAAKITFFTKTDA
jgi:hypothetical protein